MNDFVTKCLGDSKFICGDEVSVADIVIAGFYFNMGRNPNNPRKDKW